jgi:hypothetical protein
MTLSFISFTYVVVALLVFVASGASSSECATCRKIVRLLERNVLRTSTEQWSEAMVQTACSQLEPLSQNLRQDCELVVEETEPCLLKLSHALRNATTQDRECCKVLCGGEKVEDSLFQLRRKYEKEKQLFVGVRAQAWVKRHFGLVVVGTLLLTFSILALQRGKKEPSRSRRRKAR